MLHPNGSEIWPALKQQSWDTARLIKQIQYMHMATDYIYIFIIYILPWIYQTSVTYIFSKTCWNDAILRVVIFLCKTVQPQDFSWSPFRDAIGISRSDPFSARSTNVLSPRSCFNAVPIRGRMPVVALHVPKHGAFLMSLELQSRW